MILFTTKIIILDAARDKENQAIVAKKVNINTRSIFIAPRNIADVCRKIADIVGKVAGLSSYLLSGH